MGPRPWLLVPPPVVERLSDGRYRAFSLAFPDLETSAGTAEAATFVLRLMIQKRLYGRAWAWTEGDRGAEIGACP